MKQIVLMAALTSCSLGACAQVSNADLVAVSSSNCPIAASAERGAQGAVVETRNGAPNTSQSKLYMHFAPVNQDGAVPQTPLHAELNAAGIIDLAITLHGSDGRARAELTSSAGGGNLSEHFQLTGTKRSELTEASVTPKRVTNVRWIGITEIHFADGTVWHPSSDSYCNVQPNGFRRITATVQK